MSTEGRKLRRALALVGLGTALWVAPAAAVPATRNAQAAGDEPHYLLTALSLGEDLSLDVADERRELRAAPFYRATLPLQEKLRADGSRVSPHDPLLPALLAAPMALGGWVAAKLTLAALAGLLAALLLWVAVRRFEVPLRVAVPAVVCFSASAPLAVYGTQVYPEIVAALAVTVAIAALTGPLGRAGLLGLASAVVALPWLSVKYAPVAGVLAVTGLVFLLRRGDRARAGWLLAGLAASAALFAVAHLAWYGGLTPYAAGFHFRGGEWTVVGREPDYLGRATRLVGLVLDRDFGLAAWQPAYLLALPALAVLARRRAPGSAVLLATFAAGWLTATFVALTMEGWWFPGRQVVVVLPTVVLATACWAARVRAVRVAVAVGAVVGALIFAGLVVEGRLGRLDLVVRFESAVLLRPWRALLPDYRRAATLDWALHGAWIAALGAALARGWWSSGRRGAAASPGIARRPSLAVHVRPVNRQGVLP